MAFQEAKPFLLVIGIAAAVSFCFFPPLALLLLLAFLFILYFFRDPERPIPQEPTAIVSPADGKIVVVDEATERFFSQKKMRRIGIFLSVFDVHVNRSPFEGTVATVERHDGQFLDARNQEAELRNEDQNWLIETPRGPVVVRQIAGLIARRIVAWKKKGDALAKGERMGMIRFGSRTDIYFPLECEVVVKPGDRVQGGSAILAHWVKIEV
ncbi:MAG: phosphatidylserine decarboxylase family protein [bacterium]